MTDISKATPRPWELHRYAVATLCAGRRLTAQCSMTTNNSDNGATEEENDANAALILRAVNGYDNAREALSHAIGFIETLPEDCMGVGGDGDKTHWYIRDEWLDRARRALGN